jgi:hypothetical protein
MNLNDILYCPLDLPPIPKTFTRENINSYYDFFPITDPKKIESMRNSNSTGYQSMLFWKIVFLRKLQGLPKNASTWVSQFNDGDWQWADVLKNNFPELINWIETNLPFKTFKYAIALSSIGTIPEHNDMSALTPRHIVDLAKLQDPSFYRLHLDGPLIDNGFYIKNDTVGKKYTQQPKDSPGWVMSSSHCNHGNDDNLSDNKILAYVMGDLDYDRHRELVIRSYEKYKEYAILNK